MKMTLCAAGLMLLLLLAAPYSGNAKTCEKGTVVFGLWKGETSRQITFAADFNGVVPDVEIDDLYWGDSIPLSNFGMKDTKAQVYVSAVDDKMAKFRAQTNEKFSLYFTYSACTP